MVRVRIRVRVVFCLAFDQYFLSSQRSKTIVDRVRHPKVRRGKTEA
jgi:hypothetical protein